MTNSVSLNQRFLLGLGFVSFFFSFQGVGILAVPYYQMTLGVDPFLLGVAMKVPVLIAVCIGPYVGHLCDHYQGRFGRRRPFLLVFPWISGLIFGIIWMVPASWSHSEQLMYFSFFAFFFYMSNIFWSIPLKCLTYEASENEHERTEIMGFTAYFLRLSSLFYSWLFPLAKLSVFGGILIGIKFVGWFIGLFLIGLLVYLTGLFIKERASIASRTKPQKKLRQDIISILSIANMRVIVCLLFVQTLFGVYAATSDYYVLVYYIFDGDIAEGAKWKGILSTSYALIGFFSITCMVKISAKIGKISTLKWIYILTAIGGIVKWYLYVPGIGWWIIIDAFLCVSIWTSTGVLLSALISDLIAQDEIHNGEKRGGSFVAIQNGVSQFTMALAVIGFGFTLNLIGFDAQLGSQQSDNAIFGLRVILSWGTVLAGLLSYYFINRYDVRNIGRLT